MSHLQVAEYQRQVSQLPPTVNLLICKMGIKTTLSCVVIGYPMGHLESINAVPHSGFLNLSTTGILSWKFFIVRGCLSHYLQGFQKYLWLLLMTCSWNSCPPAVTTKNVSKYLPVPGGQGRMGQNSTPQLKTTVQFSELPSPTF